jgi:hypothetical protein
MCEIRARPDVVFVILIFNSNSNRGHQNELFDFRFDSLF